MIAQYAQMMDEIAYCETHSGLLMVALFFALHRLSLLRRTRLVIPFISSDSVLAAELALWAKLAFVDKPLSVFVLETEHKQTKVALRNCVSSQPKIQDSILKARFTWHAL